jgi:hypothetical protein
VPLISFCVSHSFDLWENMKIYCSRKSKIFNLNFIVFFKANINKNGISYLVFPVFPILFITFEWYEINVKLYRRPTKTQICKIG